MGYFCPKNTFLQLKYYIQSIYLISPVIFETISHFSRQLYFLAKTLHTFYKSSLSKCKFSDFQLLGLKFTKFLMPFFKQKLSFSSKCGSLFSVKRDNSVLFQLKLYMLLPKVAHQSANLQTCHCSLLNSPNSSSNSA